MGAIELCFWRQWIRLLCKSRLNFRRESFEVLRATFVPFPANIISGDLCTVHRACKASMALGLYRFRNTRTLRTSMWRNALLRKCKLRNMVWREPKKGAGVLGWVLPLHPRRCTVDCCGVWSTLESWACFQRMLRLFTVWIAVVSRTPCS